MKDVHAAVVEAEQVMLNSTAAEVEATQTLQQALEGLRELLAREPNNLEDLKERMDDLRAVSGWRYVGRKGTADERMQETRKFDAKALGA